MKLFPWLIWILTGITLYISIVWLLFFFIRQEQTKAKLPDPLPFVTIAVPAWNEGHHIEKTLRSLNSVNYPKNKYQVFVVNDGSKDDTANIVRAYLKKHKLKNFKLIDKKKNAGKAQALNSALRQAKGEYFSCLDADTTITRGSLKRIIGRFDKNVGAVISAMNVRNPHGLWGRMQQIEYVFTNFFRALMMHIGTLATTHGGLSTFNKRIIKKVGGFSEAGLTEDFEIGLRLRANGYQLAIAQDAFTMTAVPTSFKQLWHQRIRWYRGFLINHYNYRHMFFNKEFGLLGSFQMPLNLVGIPLAVFAIGLVVYQLFVSSVQFITRLFTVEGYINELFIKIPTIQEVLLSQNLKIMVPVTVGIFIWVIGLILSHKETAQKLKISPSLILYLLIYPFMVGLHWIAAIFKELLKREKVWK